MADDFEKPWHGVGTGGRTALDFANTLDWRLRESPLELLHEFDDLLRWGRSAGALERAEARALRAWSAHHAPAARRALARAIAVREAIAEVFQALARRRSVPKAPLLRLDAACREVWAARALRAEAGGAKWGWRDDSPEPDRPAWAAALDAAELLTSRLRTRVRECGDAQCGWLFLDTSKNRSRRWCSMRSCGNRNKARTFYRRAAAKRARARRSPAPRG